MGGQSRCCWSRAAAFQFPHRTAIIGMVKVDWKETPAAHMFKVDLPGLNKGQVKAEVQDGRILQISGDWVKEEEEDDIWHLMEKRRRSGKFLRRFELPENAELNQAKASMGDGVLTVTVPKKKAKPISIDISNAAQMNLQQNNVGVMPVAEEEDKNVVDVYNVSGNKIKLD